MNEREYDSQVAGLLAAITAFFEEQSGSMEMHAEVIARAVTMYLQPLTDAAYAAARESAATGKTVHLPYSDRADGWLRYLGHTSEYRRNGQHYYAGGKTEGLAPWSVILQGPGPSRPVPHPLDGDFNPIFHARRRSP